MEVEWNASAPVENVDAATYLRTRVSERIRNPHSGSIRDRRNAACVYHGLRDCSGVSEGGAGVAKHGLESEASVTSRDGERTRHR